MAPLQGSLRDVNSAVEGLSEDLKRDVMREVQDLGLFNAAPQSPALDCSAACMGPSGLIAGIDEPGGTQHFGGVGADPGGCQGIGAMGTNWGGQCGYQGAQFAPSSAALWGPLDKCFSLQPPAAYVPSPLDALQPATLRPPGAGICNVAMLPPSARLPYPEAFVPRRAAMGDAHDHMLVDDAAPDGVVWAHQRPLPPGDSALGVECDDRNDASRATLQAMGGSAEEMDVRGSGQGHPRGRLAANAGLVPDASAMMDTDTEQGEGQRFGVETPTGLQSKGDQDQDESVHDAADIVSGDADSAQIGRTNTDWVSYQDYAAMCHNIMGERPAPRLGHRSVGSCHQPFPEDLRRDVLQQWNATVASSALLQGIEAERQSPPLAQGPLGDNGDGTIDRDPFCRTDDESGQSLHDANRNLQNGAVDERVLAGQSGRDTYASPMKMKGHVKGGRSSPRQSRGLKHTSLRVKAAVERKGMTTYSEVADELVNETPIGKSENGRDCTESDNLRRRVYDVLNVFDAVGIIKKEEKQICWQGLPVCGEPGITAVKGDEEEDSLNERIATKKAYLAQLIEQYSVLTGIVRRNVSRPIESCPPGPKVLQLPFVVIHVPAKGAVEVQISEDVTNSCVKMDFHDVPFALHDDVWLLKHMGFHSGSIPSPVKHPSGPSPRLALPVSAATAAPAGNQSVLRPPMMLFADSRANIHSFTDTLDKLVGPPGWRHGMGGRGAIPELGHWHESCVQSDFKTPMNVAENLTDIRAGVRISDIHTNVPHTTGTPASEVSLAQA
eukprot:evm.model.scf_226EXC.4 EVM.evm.TU.scf_226EXC.4   scf_226EXC:33240-35579(-)